MKIRFVDNCTYMLDLQVEITDGIDPLILEEGKVS